MQDGIGTTGRNAVVRRKTIGSEIIEIGGINTGSGREVDGMAVTTLDGVTVDGGSDVSRL